MTTDSSTSPSTPDPDNDERRRRHLELVRALVRNPPSTPMDITSGITSGYTRSMDESTKVRENRLRRAAQRQGLRLQKSPLRDHRARSYGTYRLTDEETGNVIAAAQHMGPSSYGLTLDEIEDRLTW